LRDVGVLARFSLLPTTTDFFAFGCERQKVADDHTDRHHCVDTERDEEKNLKLFAHSCGTGSVASGGGLQFLKRCAESIRAVPEHTEAGVGIVNLIECSCNNTRDAAWYTQGHARAATR
jgi:hypothetical protein